MLHSAWQIAYKRLGRTAMRLVRPVQASFIGTILCLGLASPAEAPSAYALGLSAKDYAKTIVTNKSQYECLLALWTKESNWNYKAVNKSGAYGIPQIKSKYALKLDPYGQVNLGYNYILNRYKSPCNAWNAWKRRAGKDLIGGWY